MGQRVLFITLKTSFYEARINKGQYTVLLRNPTREVPNVFTSVTASGFMIVRQFFTPFSCS